MRFKSDRQRKAVMASLTGIRRPIVRLPKSEGKNLAMNPDTYKLRRRVIDMIYEAKTLIPDLPRINVRIFESTDQKRLGVANIRPGEYVVWVSADAVKNKSDDVLRHIVYHELAHTVYDARHDEQCEMMKPTVHDDKPCSKEQLQKRLDYYRMRSMKHY
jgi:hypothetical protein